MKVLLVTGLMAKDAVECYARESPVETKVLALNVAVAAFLTPQTISKALKAANLSGFDLILVPGLIRGDTAAISEAVGVRAFKGPQYAADLPTVLESLSEVSLSTTVPADELLREKLKQKALDEISRAEENRDVLLKKPDNILIGNLAVGRDFPMRILAEIVDAALLSDSEVQRLARRYVEEGADLVDVGMVAGESRPKDAARIVLAAKAAVNVPVSIDSLDPEEIKAAVAAGADLVLSVDAGNLDAIVPVPDNVAVVAIPTNQQDGFFPKSIENRVAQLEVVITKAKRLGIKKVFGDVILDPLDVSGSFCAFRQFAEINPDVPIFVGVSNVTELMDADSVGVNALVARLSSEVGASMLLATQKSDKAQGSIKEEVTASKMMFIAKRRGSVPKDLGIDLLILKDKRNREEPYNHELEQKAHVLLANQNAELIELDKTGCFRFFIDREQRYIVAAHFVSADSAEPDLIVKGKTAEGVYCKILETCSVGNLSHAAYLGSELAKAEIAMRTGKEYIQDKPLFK